MGGARMQIQCLQFCDKKVITALLTVTPRSTALTSSQVTSNFSDGGIITIDRSLVSWFNSTHV